MILVRTSAKESYWKRKEMVTETKSATNAEATKAQKVITKITQKTSATATNAGQAHQTPVLLKALTAAELLPYHHHSCGRTTQLHSQTVQAAPGWQLTTPPHSPPHCP